jgi:dTMP kinase
MPPPAFIVLDGLDGTGKSTQCRLLAEWLRAQGYTVTECTDPGSTPLGEQLREVLLHQKGELTLECEALLFMASRAQLVGRIIRPALEAGQVVVCDRFLLANVVYQGHAGGLDPALLWQAGQLSTAGLEPDLTLVLDLDPETADRRRGRPADNFERRGQEYRARVREGFLAEARRDPGRIHVIDAGPAVDQVQEVICAEVRGILG